MQLKQFTSSKIRLQDTRCFHLLKLAMVFLTAAIPSSPNSSAASSKAIALVEQNILSEGRLGVAFPKPGHKGPVVGLDLFISVVDTD